MIRRLLILSSSVAFANEFSTGKYPVPLGKFEGRFEGRTVRPSIG